MEDEALVVSSFFYALWGRDCSPQKFSKKFFRVGVWGGFEWVGGVGNSGGWNEVERGDLWSVRFLPTIPLPVKVFRSYKCKFQTPAFIFFYFFFFFFLLYFFLFFLWTLKSKSTLRGGWTEVSKRPERDNKSCHDGSAL